jgi:hypothetical protein
MSAELLTVFIFDPRFGNADIQREQPDGRVGESEQGSAASREYDADYRAGQQAKIEQAAIAAGPAQA